MMHYSNNTDAEADKSQQQAQYGSYNNYLDDPNYNSRVFAASNVAARLVAENRMMNENNAGASGYRDSPRGQDRDYRRDRYDRDSRDQERRRERDKGRANSDDYYNYDNRNNRGPQGGRGSAANKDQQAFGNFNRFGGADSITANRFPDGGSQVDTFQTNSLVAANYGYYDCVETDDMEKNNGATSVAGTRSIQNQSDALRDEMTEEGEGNNDARHNMHDRDQRSRQRSEDGNSSRSGRGNLDDYDRGRRREYERDREGRGGRDRESRDRGSGGGREGRGRDREREGSERDRRERTDERGSRDRSRGRDGRDRSWDSSGHDRAERDYQCERDYYQRDRHPNGWRTEEPNHTVMLGGLPTHSGVKNAIVDAVTLSGLEIEDIRMMTKRDAGPMCGFAFIEFKTVVDATQWMESKQGYLHILDQKVPMHYGFRKGFALRFDWDCTKCGTHNFRRRMHCFKCLASKDDVEKFNDGDEDVSSLPRSTLLFRNLDTLTTEEQVLKVLQVFTSIPIKSIRVAKDPLTGTSRGCCYVDLNSLAEAVRLFDDLKALPFPLVINKRTVSLSYSLRSISGSGSATSATVASTAVAAAQWINQVSPAAGSIDPYGSGDTSSYSTVAGVVQGYASNLVTSYTPHGLQSSASSSGTGGRVTSSSYQDYSQSETDKRDNSSTTSAAANTSKRAESAGSNAVVASAAPTEYKDTSKIGLPNALGEYDKFAVPDVSTYQFDQATNYYYDPTTGLYYDANSQYYYNAQTQQFLYWDGSLKSYLPAPTETTGAVTGTDVDNTTAAMDASDFADIGGGKKPKDKDKSDKVKIAKKIAKDMEKWAKMLNQKKENAKQGYVANQALAPDSLYKQPATADAGFAILEKRSTTAERQAAIIEAMKKKDADPKRTVGKAGGVDGSLVPQYSGGSDDEDEDGTDGGSGPLDENRLVDWQKLACLLCKRQFPTKDALTRHQQLSDLHKQNLEALQKANGQRGGGGAGDDQYRDRAKERREKYGEPDVPPPTKLKEKFGQQKTINYEEPTKHGIDSSNIGNKMLKAMGWNEGQGLGKANQGRTQIVEAHKRVHAAGLGLGGSTYGAAVGDSYKETVKKLMQTRYNELS